MILRWEKQHAVIRMLLDTGSTVPLFDEALAKKLELPLIKHHIKKPVENFAGEEVPGAGEYFTSPLELQHKQHYVLESFEIAPLCKDFDAILPNWWMDTHIPSGFFSPTGSWENLRFDSDKCKRLCTKNSCKDFPLEWDESVLTDPKAGILGMVCAAPTDLELQEAIDRVPEPFREFIPIMTSEAASVLPEHSPYDHSIEFKEGTTPPWGPIYALNETELEEL